MNANVEEWAEGGEREENGVEADAGKVELARGQQRCGARVESSAYDRHGKCPVLGAA